LRYTIIIIIIISFKAHQQKAAGRKTKLDIQNYVSMATIVIIIIITIFLNFFIPQVVKIPGVKNYKS